MSFSLEMNKNRNRNRNRNLFIRNKGRNKRERKELFRQFRSIFRNIHIHSPKYETGLEDQEIKDPARKDTVILNLDFDFD